MTSPRRRPTAFDLAALCIALAVALAAVAVARPAAAETPAPPKAEGAEATVDRAATRGTMRWYAGCSRAGFDRRFAEPPPRGESGKAAEDHLQDRWLAEGEVKAGG
jgi:hypothetical protein